MNWSDKATHTTRHLGRTFQQKRQDVSQRWSAVPDVLCWSEGILGRGSKEYCVIFPPVHHCSLQHHIPRNNYYIVLRKLVHFLFCCFKASIFAHPLVQFCNRLGKTPSNTNDCRLLAAQTRAALVGFGANSSILTAGLFLSRCCPLLVSPKQPPPSAAEENTEQRRSEQNARFNPQLQWWGHYQATG